MANLTTNEWYVFGKDSIDKKTCNKIKKYASNKWYVAEVEDNREDLSAEERKHGRVPEYRPNEGVRISDVAWCNEQWIYDIVWPYMIRANKEAGWKYNIKSAESCQITRYKKGGFYSLHQDGLGDHLSAYDNPTNTFLHGNVRKLSMSIMLNDNFEGGAFEFASYSKEQCKITPIEAEGGSVIVFPSSIEHRVAPITKGTRYSVVVWFLGPPFV